MAGIDLKKKVEMETVAEAAVELLGELPDKCGYVLLIIHPNFPTLINANYLPKDVPRILMQVASGK
jgi:hypothetical protein